ncbi:MAG TPA: acetyl-CoA synthetase [Firmicutes bacterium]|jgi:acetyl-CoA synthetase|nr:acetyl-CoA synthetase [Bacillota bacterium]
MLEKYIDLRDYHSYEEFQENFRVGVPENFNFAYDVVDEWAKQSPDKIAIVWCDEKGAEATFTFGQIKNYSDKAANFFKSLGIQKGDPVMLILKRRYEFWFAIIALHKIGAICIPATHLLKKKDLVYRNNAAEVKMVVAIAGDEVVEHIDEAQEESPALKYKALVGGNRDGWYNFSEELEKASAVWTKPTGKAMTENHNVMLLYFTSGTTGYPKMVTHNFMYPLGHILTAKYWQCVEEDKLHLTVSETGWAKSVWGKLYGQWLAGAVVFVYDFDKFVPKDLLTMIAKYKISTFCAPPTIYRYLIKEDLSQYDLSNLKYCAVAGEPLNPEVYNQFLSLTGIRLREAYGQTELTVTLATYPWIEPKPGSMGKPSPGYEIDIVDIYDEKGRSCEVGEIGEIVVRTDKKVPVGLFEGYYRDPELTKSVWHDGLYHTGDTAWRDEDGYFWFVGRTDDVIKSSGYRIGPFEVESALLEHPAVLECAVTAVPDEVRGQIVKATIVLTKDYSPSDALVKELQNHVKNVTAPYKYPRIIEFVTELPKTISGKIRRVEIREKDHIE